MSLKIVRGDQPPDPGMTADRRLWLDASQTRVLEDGDPDAAVQLAAPGQQVSPADAGRLGLSLDPEGRVQQLPLAEPAAEAEPAEEKQAEPGDDKMADRPEDKMAEPEGDKAARRPRAPKKE